nr:MAG TPA: hypothetical protein [Caudoviricetes sp.]
MLTAAGKFGMLLCIRPMSRPVHFSGIVFLLSVKNVDCGGKIWYAICSPL